MGHPFRNPSFKGIKRDFMNQYDLNKIKNIYV